MPSGEIYGLLDGPKNWTPRMAKKNTKKATKSSSGTMADIASPSPRRMRSSFLIRKNLTSRNRDVNSRRTANNEKNGIPSPITVKHETAASAVALSCALGCVETAAIKLRSRSKKKKIENALFVQSSAVSHLGGMASRPEPPVAKNSVHPAEMFAELCTTRRHSHSCV